MGAPLVILAGPTGVGKSDLAVKLARRNNGEIVSCDSMQIYRGMDIGSAKVKADERQGIPHYLLDIVDPREPFSASLYKEQALAVIRAIQRRGHLPILTGGTGLFINAVIYPMKFGSAMKSDAIRERYEALAREKGNEALHEILRKADPASARLIHANNVKRVIRALEVVELTGQPFSAFREEKALNPEFDIFYYWISKDREDLYKRIDERVDQMFREGLLEEVAGLKAAGLSAEHQSMQGIGYKECLDYLDGKTSLPFTVALIKQRSRNYAKRQMTWFRNDENCVELSKDRMTESEMLYKIESDMEVSEKNPRNRQRE